MRRFFLIILLLVALIASGFAYFILFKSNIRETTTIYIKTNDTFEDVVGYLKPSLENEETFLWVAKWKGYSTGKIIPGKYVFEKGNSNRHIVNKLKAGLQEKIRLTLAPKDRLEDWIAYIHPKIEADSSQVAKAFEALARRKGLDNFQQLKFFFFPDTHFVFWNDSPEKILELLSRDYQNFWTDERLKKAKKLNLTPEEVMNLAAIVQKESSKSEELSRIAGLYINRLNKGMKLQSDPTVLYAKKLSVGFNNPIYRVYYKDLFIDSPFNTYKYVGLPPHPITLATKTAVDAVLNAEKHDYIYMCASVDRPGYHEFSSDFAQHEQYAKKYAAWLNERNIR